MSNLGKWDRWYAIMGDQPEPFADTETYAIGARFLEGLKVEDWGCGKGWMREFIPPGRYRGIDGSRSPFADAIVDLAEYRSTTEAVFMRHVIEHDWRWPQILANAVASFTHRMVLVLFTPMASETHDMEWEPDPGVPNISFAAVDIERVIRTTAPDATFLSAPAGGAKYGPETVYLIAKPAGHPENVRFE